MPISATLLAIFASSLSSAGFGGNVLQTSILPEPEYLSAPSSSYVLAVQGPQQPFVLDQYESYDSRTTDAVI